MTDKYRMILDYGTGFITNLAFTFTGNFANTLLTLCHQMAIHPTDIQIT